MESPTLVSAGQSITPVLVARGQFAPPSGAGTLQPQQWIPHAPGMIIGKLTSSVCRIGRLPSSVCRTAGVCIKMISVACVGQDLLEQLLPLNNQMHCHMYALSSLTTGRLLRLAWNVKYNRAESLWHVRPAAKAANDDGQYSTARNGGVNLNFSWNLFYVFVEQHFNTEKDFRAVRNRTVPVSLNFCEFHSCHLEFFKNSWSSKAVCNPSKMHQHVFPRGT